MDWGRRRKWGELLRLLPLDLLRYLLLRILLLLLDRLLLKLNWLLQGGLRGRVCIYESR